MAGKELKEGFTTGACSAAAAKAATRLLLKGKPVLEIETTLPNKRKVFLRSNVANLKERLQPAALSKMQVMTQTVHTAPNSQHEFA